MVVVLDTNHFRALTDDSEIGQGLERRLVESEAEVHLCAVVVEETLQGFIGMLRGRRAGREQVAAYASLDRGLAALQLFPSIPFDSGAADIFHRLQGERIRIGTMDLKIGSICLAHQTTLLSRNLIDFEKIPYLHVENWLD